VDGVQTLLQAIDDADLEHNGRLRVVSAHWSAGGRLTVRFQLDDGESQRSAWRLRFDGVLESMLRDVFNCGLNIWHGDHPAIDQYTQQHEHLHFAGTAGDPDRLVGQLWAAHRKLVDDWIPFDCYLSGGPLRELFASGSGLLATGPTFIVEEYAKVLVANGCQPIRLVRPSAPRAQHASLAHFGESFVIAEEISARQLTS
jgi:hypothetical protein